MARKFCPLDKTKALTTQMEAYNLFFLINMSIEALYE